MKKGPCELCETEGGAVLWRDEFLRVVAVEDADYPGLCRVILQRHVAEMSDLPTPQRTQMMEAVFAVEQALRELLQADKINLASLGNITPHLHWHVIPRFRDDAHFPSPIWAERRRDAVPPKVDPIQLSAYVTKHMAMTTAENTHG
ncbi:MAG TPA: HIT family protein [Burkholderiales bacterium]|nr:HIT family protein [Burkholderiales bacterium]